MARRPSGLMRQLDCLWEGVEQLKTKVDDTTGDPSGEPGDAPDPGDLNVYFENGLTGA